MLPQDFGDILDNAFGKGAGDNAAHEYQKIWDTGKFPPNYFDMTDVLKKFPVKMTSMRDWVKQFQAVFT